MNVQLAQRVQRSFSRSFGTYHETANQQARIAADLARRLRDHSAAGHFRSALEFGCGTGHLTQRLCEFFTFDTFTVNDLSPKANSTARAVDATFLPGDARVVEWPTQPDLIATASMIQWLPDPAAFLRKAASALAPGGWLAVSGFGPDQYHQLVQCGSTAKAPGLCSSREMIATIQDQLEIVTHGQARQELRFTSPRDVLEHLRRTGVNGRAQKGWTKSRLVRFTQDYTAQFGDETGVSLTYHPIWVIARKPA